MVHALFGWARKHSERISAPLDDYSGLSAGRGDAWHAHVSAKHGQGSRDCRMTVSTSRCASKSDAIVGGASWSTESFSLVYSPWSIPLFETLVEVAMNWDSPITPLSSTTRSSTNTESVVSWSVLGAWQIRESRLICHLISPIFPAVVRDH